MAQLTKSQREDFERLTLERDMARALRWPEYTKPEPMTRAEIGLELKSGNTLDAPSGYGGSPRKVVAGWAVNGYREGSVYRIATDGYGFTMFNYDGSISASWSHDGGPIYRHKADAYRALRLELTERYAKHLVKIDGELDEAETA